MELPSPRVLRCYFDDQLQPPLPAMELEWDADAPGVAERTWYFPGHLFINGPAPTRFGITLRRFGRDRYAARLVWNELCMSWTNLRKVEIMTSALSVVLRALGTDPWHMLEQPIDEREVKVA